MELDIVPGSASTAGGGWNACATGMAWSRRARTSRRGGVGVFEHYGLVWRRCGFLLTRVHGNSLWHGPVYGLHCSDEKRGVLATTESSAGDKTTWRRAHLGFRTATREMSRSRRLDAVQSRTTTETIRRRRPSPWQQPRGGVVRLRVRRRRLLPASSLLLFLLLPSSVLLLIWLGWVGARPPVAAGSGEP
jgi:hypothetical protein